MAIGFALVLVKLLMILCCANTADLQRSQFFHELSERSHTKTPLRTPK